MPSPCRAPAAGLGRGRRLLLVALVVVAAGGLLPARAPAALVAHGDAMTPPATAPDPGAGRVPPLWMPAVGAVVRGFELPAGPYGPGHRGIDIAVPVGERARAPATGRVVFAGSVAGTSWVSLEVAAGVLVTLGPLLDPAVTTGRPVRTSAPLGRVAPGHGPATPPAGTGPAGRGAAALHLSVRVDGVYVDPLAHLVDRPRPRLAPLPAPGGLRRP